jgi:hypothetical protein
VNDFEILDFGLRKIKTIKATKDIYEGFERYRRILCSLAPYFSKKYCDHTNLALVIYETTYCCSLYWK